MLICCVCLTTHNWSSAAPPAFEDELLASEEFDWSFFHHRENRTDGSAIAEGRQLAGTWCDTLTPMGVHALPGEGAICMLSKQVVVAAGSALSLSTDAHSETPAIISGAGKTRLFMVNGGKLTLANLVLEAGFSDYGAGIVAQRQSAVVTLRSNVTIRKCVATIAGGGVYIAESAMLEISRGDTHALLEENEATKGAGLLGVNNAVILVNESGLLEARDNFAKGYGGAYGGGIFLARGSKLLCTGKGKATVEGNTAKDRGGGLYLQGGAISISHGAHLNVLDNHATVYYGGGIYLENKDSALTATGTKTQVTIRGNTAREYGGGLISMLGGLILIEEGAVIDVGNNKVIAQYSGGGGIKLMSHRTNLIIRDIGSRLIVENNQAQQSGGGVVLRDGSTMVISAGAEVNVNKNYVAGQYGGGVYLQDEATNIMITGESTHMHVESNTAHGGAGIISRGGASIALSSGAGLDMMNNHAVSESGGGMSLVEGSNLSATGNNTRIRIEGNSAKVNAGGMFCLTSSIHLKNGSSLSVKGNTLASTEFYTTSCGGGMLLKDENSTLTANGKHTRVVVENNQAIHCGGGVALLGAKMLIENQAVLLIKKNTQLKYENDYLKYKVLDTNGGGGLFLQGETSSLNVMGIDTLISIQGNEAKYNGGGAYIYQGAHIFVQEGAAMDLFNNQAARSGGGIVLFSRSSLLSIRGSKSKLQVQDNVALRDSGGGLAVGPGASVIIESPSLFRGNQADSGSGGAVALCEGKNHGATPAGAHSSKSSNFIADGGSACVPVELTFDATGEPNSEDKISWQSEPSSQFRFLDYSVRDVVKDSPIRICIPCGSYGLIRSEEFGWRSKYKLFLVVRHSGTKDELLRSEYVTGPFKLYIDCVYQSVSIDGALFQRNTAKYGGSLGVSKERGRNSFYHITSSTFDQNSASSKGGAIHVSGFQSAVYISTCTMLNNYAGEDRGGAISSQEGAAARIFDTYAINNSATSGEGGFLSSYFSGPVLLKNVNISDSKSGKFRGGGAIAVYGTKIALDRVKIEGCTAGSLGGGAITMSSRSEVHLTGGSQLIANKAKGGFGGHIYVSGSLLNVTSSLSKWEPYLPVFTSTILLGAPYQHSTSLDYGTSTSGGSIFCIDCQARFTGVHLGSGTKVAYSTSVDENGLKRGGGGAISALFCNIVLHGALLVHNTAEAGDGGALLLQDESKLMTTEGCIFANNSAPSGSGGAIMCNKCKSVNLTNGTLFEKNTARKCGGAIGLLNPISQLMHSSGSLFKGNVADSGDGGAVFMVDDNMKSNWKSNDGDVFYRNQASTGYGGALFAAGMKVILDIKTSCVNNTAPNGGGGCIFWDPLANSIESTLWVSRAPVLATHILFDNSNNTAAFGNNIATSAASLGIYFNDKSLRPMAPPSGGILDPQPQAKIFDYYGNIVLGRLLEGVSGLNVHCSNDSTGYIFGERIPAIDSISGTLSYTTLSLGGIPGRGPYTLRFVATYSSDPVGVLRRVEEPMPHQPVLAWIRNCSFGQYMSSNQCVDIPPGWEVANCTSTGIACKAIQRCAAGKYWTAIDGETPLCNLCPAGYSSPEGSSECEVCGKGRYSRLPGKTCEQCPIDTFQDEELLPSLSCKTCPIGYAQNTTGSQQCLSLRWQRPEDCTSSQCLDDSDRDHPGRWKCVLCPPGGDCSDSTAKLSTLRPLFGWWRIPEKKRGFVVDSSGQHHMILEMFARCLFAPACLGAPNPALRGKWYQDGKDLALLGYHINSTCANGHKLNSQLCHACQESYVRSRDGHCSPCDSSSAVPLFFICAAVFIMGYIGLVALKLRSYSRVTLRREFDPVRHRKSSHSTLKRIILTHMQTAILVLGLSVPWPQTITHALVFMSAISGISEQARAVQCLSNVGVEEAGFFYGTLLFSSLFPFAMIGFLAAFWFWCVPWWGSKCLTCGAVVVHNKRGERNSENFLPSTLDMFFSSSVLFWFLYLPNLLHMGFGVFKCQIVGEPAAEGPAKPLYFSEDMDEACHELRHIIFEFLVGIPMLIIFALFVPIVIMLQLQKAHKAKKLNDPSVMLRWSLMYSGYKRDKYWYELVVLGRKYFVIIVSTFLRSGIYQLQLIVALFITSLFVHITTRPFGKNVEGSLHHMESTSLALLTFWSWCAVYFGW